MDAIPEVAMEDASIANEEGADNVASQPESNTSQKSPGGGPSPDVRSQGHRTPGTGNRPGRADVGPRFARPNITMSGSLPEVDADDGLVTDNTVIWGTTINAAMLEAKVSRFLRMFREGGDMEAKYRAIIVEAHRNQEPVINLDTADLRAFDRTLYTWLVNYPREVVPIFDKQIAEILITECEVIQAEAETYLCRPYNLEERKTIRDLDPSDIDKLISVEGMVTRTSAVIPDIRTAYFRCEKCSAAEEVINDGGKVDEPEKCRACGAKWAMALVHNLCVFTNKQMVKMQEKPNDIPEGETPHAVNLHVYESNVDVCRPGDRVTITGTFRAVPMRVNPKQRALHALYKTYIDVNHIHRDEKSRLFSVALTREQQQAAAEGGADRQQQAPGGQPASAVEGSQSQAPTSQRDSAAREREPDTLEDQFVPLGNMTTDQLKAREEAILELSRDPRLYERLVASIAPNIWEMDDVKRGLLCLLFGGMSKVFPGGRVRGEINTLLVGDPSVSKSQLLSYVHALAPRGIYTSGKGSSAVGLTAYITRDPETREMVLESGALVLSDRGVCCIDEFDKMSDSARSMLHEAMEQQTVSVAKAGLIATLNARTSVCACANPIGSRYNPHLSVSENINLPPTLLTRFDLIYLVLDKFDEERDRRLARHLVSLFHETEPNRQRAQDLPVNKELLRDYIAYARARISPVMGEEAASALVEAYRDLRRDGRERKVVVATPRQLESLIRLSEALARMKLSETVTRDHVQEAVRLWYSAMSGSASSGEGGVIDMDNIITGATTAARQVQRQLPDDLRAILSGAGGRPVSVSELYGDLQRAMQQAGKGQVTQQQLVDALRQLEDLVVYDERTGVVRPRATGTAA